MAADRPGEPVTLRAALGLLIQQAVALVVAFGLSLSTGQVVALEAFLGTVLLVALMGFPRLNKLGPLRTARGSVGPIGAGIDPDYVHAPDSTGADFGAPTT